MIPLGLSASDLATFNLGLSHDLTLTTSVFIQDLNGDTQADVSTQTLDGQVNVDTDREISRSLNITFNDPTHSLGFDTDNPDDGAIYLDRMLYVEQSYLMPALGFRVDVPIFNGPAVKFDRDGDEVSVECQGKEALAMNESWRPLTLKKGMRKTEAIRTILERTGETRFSFPVLRRLRLPETVNLTRMSKPWLVASQIADSMDRQLYYSGDGVCRLRAVPSRSVFSITDKPDRSLITSRVQVTKDAERLKNTVWVQGGRRLGKGKGNVSAVAVAPRNHPLSPWALGRNGEPRHYVEEWPNDNLRTDAEARRVADRVLRNRLLEVTDLTLSMIPVPHLDPSDIVHVEFGTFAADIRLRRFSLPITVGEDMTLGTIRRVSANRKRIRR